MKQLLITAFKEAGGCKKKLNANGEPVMEIMQVL